VADQRIGRSGRICEMPPVTYGDEADRFDGEKYRLVLSSTNEALATSQAAISRPNLRVDRIARRYADTSDQTMSGPNVPTSNRLTSNSAYVPVAALRPASIVRVTPSAPPFQANDIYAPRFPNATCTLPPPDERM
jgi:hypothetical protein